MADISELTPDPTGPNALASGRDEDIVTPSRVYRAC
jgi:hypothetical protein